ncbi:MAG TPA: hypothetical protein VK934_10125 [Fimbriimonas sp.]|nr:hypothetical protein [Fimbriimonas sp.]
MSCKRAKVLEVTRPHPIGLVAPSDFKLGERCDFPPEQLVEDQRFSLYCFDIEHKAALFVECPDPEVVDNAAFYYQAQAEHAAAVVSVPLSLFHDLADGIPEREVVWIHSVGRCGSTLMSKVLGTLQGVKSISEPDDLTQLLHFDRAIVPPLLASSVRWRGSGPQGTVAIKTRSEVLVLADLIADVFPDAKHLFLYRNGIAWMNTILRNWPPDMDLYDPLRTRQMAERWAETVPLIREYPGPLNAIQVRMLAWISCMEGYLQLVDRGLDTLPIRFEDLTADPKLVIHQAFEFLAVGEPEPQLIQQVLAKDSQAGTIYDREERHKNRRHLTQEEEQYVKDIVSSRPRLMSPEMIMHV